MMVSESRRAEEWQYTNGWDEIDFWSLADQGSRISLEPVTPQQYDHQTGANE